MHSAPPSTVLTSRDAAHVGSRPTTASQPTTGSKPTTGSTPTDRLIPLVLLGGVFVLSIVVTMLGNPDGIVVSRDPGVPPTPVLVLLVPALLVGAVTLMLPRGEGSARATVHHAAAARWETAGLLGLAITFPLLVPLLPLPEDYVLLKAAMFLLVPCTALALLARRRGPSVALQRPRVSVVVLLVPALLLGVLSSVGPFAPGGSDRWPPLAVLLVGATATAITAGLGEELLFRRFLQTRLEALLGPWTGILLASLLFGLMHVFSHGGGAVWERAAQVIAMQGTTGIVLGLMWAKWRRIWVCVLAHMLINGLGVVLYLAGVVL